MSSFAARRLTHDAGITIRLNTSLLDRIERAAVREGVTRSEFMRTALRREAAAVAA